MKLQISTGNTKMGNIPSVSLPPITTCPENVPCAKICYCMRPYMKNARKVWENNYFLYEDDPDSYFEQLKKFLDKHSPEVFRWHVGGDIPDQKYADMMADLMYGRSTRFLVFTKKYNFDLHQEELSNFKVKYSVYGSFTTNKTPKAYIFEDIDSGSVVPDLNTKKCVGKCDSCYICWYYDYDILFKKH